MKRTNKAPAKRATIGTQIHFYSLNLETPGHRERYDEIVAQIKANGPRGHQMYSIGKHDSRTGTIDVSIEPDCLFDNQWNTTDERVFDWYERAVFDDRGRELKHLKQGHWLTLTPAMIALREQTLCCGYCGAFYSPDRNKTPASGFCSQCMSSEYLKESELYMLRLVRVRDQWEKRTPLSDSEKAELVPQWREMRRTCDLARASKARAREREQIIEKLAEKRRELEDGNAGAKEEHDGMLWIWEHGFSTDNWIYYRHTRTFALGWRYPADDDTASRWLDVASEFPFNYEVKAKNRELCKSRKNEPATA